MDPKVKQAVNSKLIDMALENFIEYAFIFEGQYLSKEMLHEKAIEFKKSCEELANK